MKFANFSVAQFLAEYWQRKPLLIKQALPDFVDLLSPQELAGLACEPELESRLISTRGQRYSLKTGPFSEADFTSAPASKWTLLVQAVDQFVPEVKTLMQTIDFIPSWRVDDVMISYATKGGGVGPHFDYYDVFLVQGQGTRTWRLGQHCTSEEPLRPNSDLKLLSQFATSAEYQLECGDVLYVPPGLAHWGISADDSLCYSLGFRAPAVEDLVFGFTDYLADTLTEDQRFCDPPLSADAQAGEISPAALAKVKQLILDTLNDDAALRRWFGNTQTAPRYPELIQPARKVSLGPDTRLVPDLASRFAWCQEEQGYRLFVNGTSLTLKGTRAALKLLPVLCQHGKSFVAGPYLGTRSTRELLEQLIRMGAIQTE